MYDLSVSVCVLVIVCMRLACMCVMVRDAAASQVSDRGSLTTYNNPYYYKRVSRWTLDYGSPALAECQSSVVRRRCAIAR